MSNRGKPKSRRTSPPANGQDRTDNGIERGPHGELSGVHRLKRSMIELGNRGLAPLDRRTRVGKAVHAWKDELLQDLGGIENISTQQLSIVDLATRTKVLLDSVDAWLLRQDGVINRRKRSLYPIVRERQQLADSMAKYMQMLGLERRQRPTESLESYVARKYGQKTEAELEP